MGDKSKELATAPGETQPPLQELRVKNKPGEVNSKKTAGSKTETRDDLLKCTKCDYKFKKDLT